MELETIGNGISYYLKTIRQKQSQVVQDAFLGMGDLQPGW